MPNVIYFCCAVILCVMQVMSLTKALGILNFVTARGLDNGDRGALKLSNQVTLYSCDWA